MMIALSVSVLVVVAAAWTPLRRSRIVLAVGSSLVVIGFVAMLVVGSRGMIVPLGIAVALATVTVALRVKRRASSRPRTIAEAVTAGLTSFAAAAAAVVAGGAAWALPTLELPPPSAGFGVGTSTLQWDTGAPEVLTADPADTRVLVAQLWYPTEATGPGQAYLESSTISDAIAAQAGFPGFLLDGVVRGSTHAIADAPRADGTFPLVLFSPGLGGVRTQNSAWAEDLASHGYIVAAVDHPYDSAAVVLEDGTVISSTLTTTGNDETDQRIADDLAGIRADDLIATLDRLETDLVVDGVATAGHSIGGAAAILAASRDDRVDAVVNLDGLPRGGRPTVPVLAIVAGEGTGSAESDARYDAALTEVLAACGTRVEVQSPHPDEQAAHRAVAQQVKIVDRVRAGEHSADYARGLRGRVRRGQRQLLEQVVEASRLRQPRAGTRPAADTRFGSSKTGRIVREGSTYEVSLLVRLIETSQSQSSLLRRALSFYATLTLPTPVG